MTIVLIYCIIIMTIVPTSYYRLICWDFLSCPGEVEEQEQRPWQVISDHDDDDGDDEDYHDGDHDGNDDHDHDGNPS